MAQYPVVIDMGSNVAFVTAIKEGKDIYSSDTFLIDMATGAKTILRGIPIPVWQPCTAKTETDGVVKIVVGKTWLTHLICQILIFAT